MIGFGWVNLEKVSFQVVFRRQAARVVLAADPAETTWMECKRTDPASPYLALAGGVWMADSHSRSVVARGACREKVGERGSFLSK